MPRRNRNVQTVHHQIVIEPVDLTRVDETPAPRPLPVKPAARRRAMRVRGW